MATPITPPRSPSSSGPSTPPLPDLPVVEETQPYDLVGVGFGPTHLALAIAFGEEHPGKRMLFVDAKEAFSWHSALLLPESRMQISFLKDLAMFRNPRSPFTFLSYLHECGTDRLAAFSNIGSWTPSRIEWAGYFAWAAKKLDHLVKYSTRVISIQPVQNEGSVTTLKISTINAVTNSVHVFYTRNLSLGPGATPRVPELFSSFLFEEGGPGYIAHTSDYLPTLRRVFGSDRGDPDFVGRFAVVGGGQSAAEVFNDLRSRFPKASVDMIHRSSALVPADDSPFVNSRAFDPDMTDEFNKLPLSDRVARVQEFKRANYTCIAPELLESMYKMLYRQRVEADVASLSGNKRAGPTNRILANSIVDAAIILPPTKGSTEHVELTIASTLPTGPPATKERYVVAFLGTGYHRPAHTFAYLSGIASHLPTLSDFLTTGKPADKLVEREYYVAPARQEEWAVRVFLLGSNERSHGLSDSLLSVGAVRAGEVVGALVGLDAKEEKRTKN